MKVAVFGGTGFVGSYIIDRLLDEGHSPKLLVRSESIYKVPSVSDCELIIGEITKKSIDDCYAWFNKIHKNLSDSENKIAEGVIKEIKDRLEFLNKVGLDYLSLARASKSLSGGESQRIRLASQIGSGLTGVLYVLDEPSIGLHQKDNQQLINIEIL